MRGIARIGRRPGMLHVELPPTRPSVFLLLCNRELKGFAAQAQTGVMLTRAELELCLCTRWFFNNNSLIDTAPVYREGYFSRPLGRHGFSLRTVEHREAGWGAGRALSTGSAKHSCGPFPWVATLSGGKMCIPKHVQSLRTFTGPPRVDSRQQSSPSVCVCASLVASTRPPVPCVFWE